MSTPSVLTKICATKREEVAARRAKCSDAELRARIDELPACRDFHGALAECVARAEPAIIAEFKRASPSAGWIHRDADAGDVARAYERGGAACMSVLTDVEYFRGSDADLLAAREACALPVIRKDFVVDPYQVYETRALGADAMLLIVAALDDSQLQDFSALGFELGLSVLVEVHDAEEMDRALKVPGHLLGINNRDLHVFETRLETSEQLAPQIPVDRVGVCESGLHTRADIERMQAAGLHAFLIGEALMRGGDPVASLRALRGR
ncbi:indole-3-glycerol phosphate synthase TrpC [Wenzhouxiangella sp. XN79A]|uniref:indole-3-glycerol phosphate synthase TrpC n=1 Tax=Wenzhouxiangella sp. XN79A TaxID=2724193 RepID=UPI00144A81B4|nr:indole-3-glycerol phosphate synthase TrpC [Wenzhouxiangella sp. XN79A]NKI34706.1 indole-3-glycerol phosphate synthase TrpC [Wenzhouxiangella sp. XN79A]